MGLTLLIFGLLTGSFLAALVGLLGARRRIGFGWTFFLSVLFTPLIVFDAASMSYRSVGEIVGKAWGDGTKFQ